MSFKNRRIDCIPKKTVVAEVTIWVTQDKVKVTFYSVKGVANSKYRVDGSWGQCQLRAVASDEVEPTKKVKSLSNKARHI